MTAFSRGGFLAAYTSSPQGREPNAYESAEAPSRNPSFPRSVSRPLRAPCGNALGAVRAFPNRPHRGRHWSEYFLGRYISPNVVGVYDGASPNGPRCGTERLPELNASYCRPNDSLARDVTLMARGYKSDDTWPYLVIAHEWGHAIQQRIGGSFHRISIIAARSADRQHKQSRCL